VGRTLEGLVLNAVGNLLIGRVVRGVLERIEAAAGLRGLRMGAPVSPGQGDWDLGQQGALFSLVEPGIIGVRLTPEMVMVPLKSVSVMVGLGRDMAHEGSVCDSCILRHSCRYRRVASPGRARVFRPTGGSRQGGRGDPSAPGGPSSRPGGLTWNSQAARAAVD